MKRIILLLIIANNCYSQNPDGKLDVKLLDSNKLVHFYFKNDSNVIIDTSKMYTIINSSIVPNGCGYTTPNGYEFLLFRNSKNSITNENTVSLGLAWCGEVTLTVLKKTKERTDTMKIIFTGIYQRSAGIEIIFHSGTFIVNVEKLYKEGKLINGYYIKAEYLKEQEQ